MAIRLFILGVRRSGTTIFWKSLRQDPDLLAYDEPFNPLLYILPRTDGIKNPEEFSRLIDADPDLWWSRYAPIAPEEEYRCGLSDRQSDYLRWLGDSAENVAMDITRCHFKVEDLHRIAPEAVLVHLYRPAAEVATSHLLPSDRGLRAKARQASKRMGFWTRTGDFNSWHFEWILGDSPRSAFAEHLRAEGLDPEEVYRLPAVGKLMAYWWTHYRRLERVGRGCFGERFVSVGFDEFCGNPAGTYDRVYGAMGVRRPEMDFGKVHPPNPAYRADSPKWAELANALGIDPTLCHGKVRDAT